MAGSVGAVLEARDLACLRGDRAALKRQWGLSEEEALRLEHAHLLLKGTNPAPTVTDIALLSGFNHLGRFPRSYRNRFGDLPSRVRSPRH